MSEVGAVIFSVKDLNFNIGTQQLFSGAEAAVHSGEKVALLGRNGCGKSTFLRMVYEKGHEIDGNFTFSKKIRINFLRQDADIDTTKSLRQNIKSGLEYFTKLFKQYENPAINSDQHAKIEEELAKYNAWNLDEKVNEVIAKLNLPANVTDCSTLSGGEKRRLALAKAVVGEPDLLLLDEPTNHLDTETIAWIEDFLNNYRGTCLFVTHDRCFLDKVATRVIELDNGKFYSYPGNYADFLIGKSERENRENSAELKRQKFLRSEIDWVRRSPKARLKRNLGRLKRFQEIESQNGPQRVGNMELILPEPSRLGNKIVDLKNIVLNYGEINYIPDFSFSFEANMKLGVIGKNGTGKSSLLKIITGELQPSSGSVKIAPTVEFNYVDQGRLKLNLENTVFEELGNGNDFVNFGSAKISIWTYLRRFLFEDDRIKTQIKYLSGGEKARLILAKILKNGGNFLILDEPTNDLDLPTLRLLEEALANYQGCLVVVSHDRYFLNRICNGIIAFDGQGHVDYQLGDYDYYLEKKNAHVATTVLDVKFSTTEQKASLKKTAPPSSTPKKKKLSYKLQRELDGMEACVESKEEHIAKIEEIFSSKDFFEKHGDKQNELQSELEQHKLELEQLYARWDELESMKADLENS